MTKKVKGVTRLTPFTFLTRSPMSEKALRLMQTTLLRTGMKNIRLILMHRTTMSMLILNRKVETKVMRRVESLVSTDNLEDVRLKEQTTLLLTVP